MSAITSAIARMSPRERILVGGLGVVVVCFLLFLAVLQVSTSLDEIEEENFANAEVLRSIHRNADKLRESERQEAAQKRKFARKAPPLTGWLEQIATKRSLEIPEAQDKPEVNLGKNFVERSVEIRLRKIGLLVLTEFMVDVENAPYPVAVSKLHVRRRMNESDSYDVEMLVSTYDFVQGGNPTKLPAGKKAPSARRAAIPAED